MIMKTTRFFGMMLFAISLTAIACTNVNDPKPDPDPVVTAGDGTKALPFSVTEIIALNPTSTTVAVKTAVWMRGYIVGYYNGTPSPSILETVAPFTDDVNIMLAKDSTETDKSKCVCIQLPAGAVRTALGLKTVSTNIKKEILVYGDVMLYNTLAGIKNTNAYWFVKANTGLEPPVGADFNIAEMTIADLRTQWTGTSKTITDKKKIVGVVISDLVGGNMTTTKTLTITSVDNTAGIIVLLNENNTYIVGDKIEIALEGMELNQYGLALQLKSIPTVKTRKIATGIVITPKVTTIANVRANYASMESTLVTVTGTITSTNGFWGSASAHQSNTLTSGSDVLTLFVAKYATFVTTAIPTGVKSVTGIAGQFSTATATTYQLIVRNLDDVK